MASTTVDNNILPAYPVRRVVAGAETDQVQTVTSGLEIPYYDYVAVTYPLTTQEVYVFKTGGVAGTTVGTITINYVDATKADILNVART